jgi:hypothetical protein
MIQPLRLSEKHRWKVFEKPLRPFRYGSLETDARILWAVDLMEPKGKEAVALRRTGLTVFPDSSGRQGLTSPQWTNAEGMIGRNKRTSYVECRWESLGMVR